MVAVTAETAPDVVESMLRAGVVGYVAKGRIGSTLPDIVARIHEGEVVLAAPTAVRALRRLDGPRSPLVSDLGATPWNRQPSQTRRSSTCLLYTSDAADE